MGQLYEVFASLSGDNGDVYTEKRRRWRVAPFSTSQLLCTGLAVTNKEWYDFVYTHSNGKVVDDRALAVQTWNTGIH